MEYHTEQLEQFGENVIKLRYDLTSQFIDQYSTFISRIAQHDYEHKDTLERLIKHLSEAKNYFDNA